MKYRKKPVVVEAEQYHAYPESGEWPKGVQVEEGGGPFVVTAHGQKVYVQTGDWIIAEPDNRGYYPCKDDIFRATYEPVEDHQ